MATYQDIELFADDLQDVQEQLFIEYVNEQFETNEDEYAEI